jgi:hypothetical protein
MTAEPTTKPAKAETETGDWIITFAVLVVMTLAFLATRDWPANAAFFPRLLSGLAIGLSVLRVVILVRAAIAVRSADGRVQAPSDDQTRDRVISDDEKSIAIEGPDSDEEGDELELHDIFAMANLRTWAGVVGWLLLFFIGRYLVGFLAILVIFTVAYLRVVEHAKYWQCALYVLGTAGVIYLLFVALLHLPLPLGLLTASLGF